MKVRYCTLLFLLFTLLSAGRLFAQEASCSNGIDDDGDGFIDCYDTDCIGNASCKDFFMGANPTCEAKPTQFPEFKMKVMWQSPVESASTYTRVSVGDVDADGIPEVLAANRFTKKMFVLSGTDGSIKQEIVLDFVPNEDVVIADINNDGYAELFIMGVGSDALEAFRYDTTSKKFARLWKIKASRRTNHNLVGVADFKEQGKAQLYYYNEVLDAETGTRLVKGSNNDWHTNVNSAPVAVDVLADSECQDCKGLELVSGGIIYSVDLGTGAQDGGTLTPVRTMAADGLEYFVKKSSIGGRNYSSSSVADYNLDGYLDVISSGATGSIDGPTTLFYWDVKNKKVLTYSDPTYNWKNGTGRLNIADIDGDGKLNVTYVTGSYLYALDHEFKYKWRTGITEGTSGFTGCTVFDFNGDGAYETVYRDELSLYIINGKTGEPYRTIPCQSRTSTEYPVVADVDGDGATEICVACNENDGDKGSYEAAQFGRIRVFESDGENWVPARKLWNQHAYFNVNVNDNLTVPRQMQKHHLVFSSADCSINGGRPLNTFLNQSPYLKPNGCPSYGSANFKMVDGSFQINPPTCPDKEFSVSFQVRNEGDIAVSGIVPFSFFNGTPKADRSNLLGTSTTLISNMSPGTTISVNNVTVTGPGSAFDLFVVFNDPASIRECDPNDNILSARVNPLPMAVEVVKVQDNISCGQGGSQGSGKLRAYVKKGTSEITSGYSFTWYAGSQVSGTPVATGPTAGNLPEGTYTVVATHTQAGCSSAAQQGIVGTTTAEVSVAITKISDVTRCDEPNGVMEAKVFLNGAEVAHGGYEISWIETGTGKVVAIGNRASNLNTSVGYTVKAVSKATACFGVANAGGIEFKGPQLSIGLKSLAHILCSSTSEVVLEASGPGGAHIEWFTGLTANPVNEITTLRNKSTATGLAAGNYTVRLYDSSSKCASSELRFIIEDKVSYPKITGTLVPNTACVASLADGGVQISTEPAGDYTYEWFAGDNVTAPKVDAAHVDAATHALINVAGGAYTLRVTNTANNCATVSYFTVPNAPATPVVGAIRITKNEVCQDDANRPYTGALEVRSIKIGTVTINHTDAAFSEFTFNWYKGQTTNASALLQSGASNRLENLDGGKYSVTATNTRTGCVSARKTVTLGEVLPQFTIATQETAKQTSCDAAQPNGKLMPVLTGGTALDASIYTAQWYEGNKVDAARALPASQHNGLEATGLKANTEYTVLVTNLQSGCTALATGTLTEVLTKPVLSSVTIAAIQDCQNGGRLTANLAGGANPADYTFSWYKGTAATGTPVLSGAGQNVLSSIGGNNLPSGDYAVVVRHNQTSCVSLLSTARLESPAPVFVIDAEVTQPIAGCTGSPGTMTAWVEVNGVRETAGYTFSWYKGIPANLPADFYSDPAVALPGAAVDNDDVLNTNEPGPYTLVVQNIATGCREYKVVNMESVSAPVILGISAPDITACGQTSTVTINIQPAQGEGYNKYDFYLFKNLQRTPTTADIGAALQSYTPGTAQGPAVFGGLAAGNYQVLVVENITGAGCFNSKDFRIRQLAEAPEIASLTVSANQNCSGTSNGSLQVSITPKGNDVGNAAATFTYVLKQKSNGVEVAKLIAQGTSATFANLPANEYVLEVTSDANNCTVTSAETIRVLFTPERANLTVSSTANSYCSPNNGGLRVEGVSLGTLTDYQFFFYTEAAYAAFVGGGPAVSAASSNEAQNLAPGNYVVLAQRITPAVSGMGCESHPVFISIADTRVYPELDMSSAPNTSCQPTAFNGSVAVAAPAGGNYSYQWKKISTDQNGQELETDIAGASSSSLNDLPAGTYKVVVTDNTTGCSVEGMATVADAPVVPQLQLNSRNQDECNPTGEVWVTSVSPDDADFTNYTFSWYKGDPNNGGTLMSGTSDRQTGLEAGVYYVTAQRLATALYGPGCASAPAMVRVEKTASDPLLALGNYSMDTSCEGENGSLSVSASRQDGSAGNFSYSWSNGATTETISGLAAGSYTLTVTDQDTDCKTTATYNVVEDPYQALVALSTTPVSYCDNSELGIRQNGEAVARILNPRFDSQGTELRYNFHWFSGRHAEYPAAGSGDPSFIGITQDGEVLKEMAANAEGYTVFAREDFSPLLGCNPAGLQFSIEDQSQPIAAEVEVLAAMTRCDESLADGQLTASVGGSTDGYRFYWFELDAAGQRSQQVSWGAEASFLKSGVPYELEVMNLETGCTFTRTYEVPQEIQPVVLQPTDVQMTPQTDCMWGNGTLRASVGGQTTGYSFSWARLAADGTIAEQYSEIGPYLSDLEAGTYQVQALRRETGCQSEPVQITVGSEFIYPDFELQVESYASCDGIKMGKVMVNGRTVARVEWYREDGSLLQSGGTEAQLPAGNYVAVAYNIYNCSFSKPFKIENDIHPYKAVTPNKDGKNDHFIVDCIEEFPSNDVQIFNRAGTLVFEMQGYNNFDKIFEGRGNRGIYINNNELPVGTYFYIINKNVPGHKPYSGYLELIR